jgi:type II secretory pathway component PulM
VRRAARVAAWLAARTPRERLLVVVAAAITTAAVVLVTALTARDDLLALSARVAGHERELADVRRLAATLAHETPPATGEAGEGASLAARLEAVAGAVVGRERIASMTPASGSAGEERVTLRVSGASLAEAVQVMHALEAGPPRLPITHLELRKHPDDATRFELSVEVAQLTGAP